MVGGLLVLLRTGRAQRLPDKHKSYPQVINSLWISMEFGSLPNYLEVLACAKPYPL